MRSPAMLNDFVAAVTVTVRSEANSLTDATGICRRGSYTRSQ